MHFAARFDPPPAALAEYETAAPDNPFATAAYARFRQMGGDHVWAFELRECERLVCGCLAFERTGRLNRSVDIPSIPANASALFWKGVLHTCRRRHVSTLELDSFASPETSIPQLPHESRHARAEYVLDLEGSAALRLATNHRRGIARARERALTVRRTVEEQGIHAHDELMRASMARRAGRGETVGLVSNKEITRRLLASGSGELFQAMDPDARVLSSVLVLRAQMGGYYQSAGTSPEGMECGASPFLITSIAALLAVEGKRVFNLGGAGEDSPGLKRFKAGFGARCVPLDAATCCPSGAWRVALAQRARRLQERAQTLLNGLRGFAEEGLV